MIDEAAGFTDRRSGSRGTPGSKKALDEAIMIFIADSKNVFATQKAKVNDVTLEWSSTYPLLFDASINA